jgi:GNAT superfamily N-acetyltransferase
MHHDAITIDYLKNHETGIPQLAKYSYQEWRPVYDRAQTTFDDVVKSYAQRVNIDALPLALGALHRGVIIGTGSLKVLDLGVRPQLTPWMGGLFVVEAHRGHGVATALIRRLTEEACRLKIMRLCLWTPSAEGLYAKLGWVSLERLDYCGYKISIMEKRLNG